MNPQGALAFLIGLAFNAYIVLVLIRFVLQAVRADFFNPVSQFVVRATNPVLAPLRRIIPGFRGMDMASLVLILVLITVKILVLFAIYTGQLFISPMLLVGIMHDAGYLVLQFFFWLILAGVIMSWVIQDPGHPAFRVVRQLTEPVMAPARRLIPPMGGLDLSPMLVIVAIIALQMLFGLHAPFVRTVLSGGMQP